LKVEKTDHLKTLPSRELGGTMNPKDKKKRGIIAIAMLFCG
jgi:hypothetical protein